MKYYALPLQFETLIQGGQHPDCSLEISIRHFIDLVVLTGFEEYRREETFGCEIWNKEFDVLPQESRWESEVRQSIFESIALQESRLEELSVDVKMGENSLLMKEIDIKIQARIKFTGEPFEHHKIIYLCPKSVE